MVHNLKKALTIFLALTGLWLTASAQTRSDRLSGTWRLNAGRSDDAGVVAERATRSLNVNDRQRARENLLRRLGAPSAPRY